MSFVNKQSVKDLKILVWFDAASELTVLRTVITKTASSIP